jgi:hypothetical protein
MNHSDNAWQKLVRAANPSQNPKKSPASPQVTGIRKLQQRVREMTLTLTWRKVSLGAALFALLLLAAILFWDQKNESDEPLIRPDALEILPLP